MTRFILLVQTDGELPGPLGVRAVLKACYLATGSLRTMASPVLGRPKRSRTSPSLTGRETEANRMDATYPRSQKGLETERGLRCWKICWLCPHSLPVSFASSGAHSLRKETQMVKEEMDVHIFRKWEVLRRKEIECVVMKRV